jgi:nucleoside-diphosphate-sugar epimerase
LDFNQIEHLVEVHKIDEIYLMAALSATAENPAFAWDLNMNSLFHVLNLAKAKKNKKIFWPSSIAVFGPTTQKKIRLNTPSWSRPRYTESASNLVKDGVNTTIISLV